MDEDGLRVMGSLCDLLWVACQGGNLWYARSHVKLLRLNDGAFQAEWNKVATTNIVSGNIQDHKEVV